jgi:hypothetical protein
MKRTIFFLLSLSTIFMTMLADNEQEAAINLQHNVDSGRTHGDVTIKSGIEFEIESSGTVTLHDGFKVEKGATFAVYPSSF